MFETLEKRFKAVAPACDFWSLRFHRQDDEYLLVRQDVVQPVRTSHDEGVIVTVIDGRGLGYAGTSDLSLVGLTAAAHEALTWARRSAGHSLFNFSRVPYPHPRGDYQGREEEPWGAVPLKDKLDMLRAECARLKIHDRIVDWKASLWHTELTTLYLTSGGGRVRQTYHYLVPSLVAVANEGSITQRRSSDGHTWSRQGGLEILRQDGFFDMAPVIAEEALDLLHAPNCPSGKMDLLLAPDQMVLQIHESIGHPLELDRILGDERNYAGTSFVRPDMFGTYRYGSPLLNVTFDPTVAGEFAGYRFDDEGMKAEKAYLIKDGILLRGLGGVTSMARSGVDGVACARSQSWNRPPIDRMANVNVEPGDSTLEQMIQSVEHGIYMKTNESWSIDDSRNKFQFGCEWARLIEDGRLTSLCRTPNYRGVSGTFWRSLKMVGDTSTMEVRGSPFCGKGEPNQLIRVGHASPACLFGDVDVFGGEG